MAAAERPKTHCCAVFRVRIANDGTKGLLSINSILDSWMAVPMPLGIQDDR
jgi:hypothetical protein